MMTLSTRKQVAVTAAALIVIAAPTGAQAFGATYSSDRGIASGSFTWTGTKNFRYDLSIRSYTGVRVYSSYIGVRDSFIDTSKTRFHGNTTSRTGQRFTGTKNGTTGETGWSALQILHCEDKSYVSDYCGPRGPNFRRP